LDRQRLGDSLVKGPFTTIYPGGIYAGTSFYDKDSTVYYPFSVDSAKEALAAAGLTDTDGNGFVNLPSGEDLNVTLLSQSDYATDKTLAEGVVAMMADAGVKVTLSLLTGKDFDNARDAGKFDWIVYRNQSDLITVVQNTDKLAPVGPSTAINHRANAAGELDLLPFEQEMVTDVNAFIGSRDAAERIELMKKYQNLYTENLFGIGLTAYPGALIVNKRFDNIPAGAPIYMYNWAEDNIIRERVFVPADKQIDAELHPNSLPGEMGGPGPVMAK
jgi:peptide/nickel transport system substrate-binding protein